MLLLRGPQSTQLINSLEFYLLCSFLWCHPSTFLIQEIIKNKKESLLLKNEEVSEKYCQHVLDQLSIALMESISEGTFSVSGGHKNYRRAKERIEQRYWEVPRKGVKVRIKGNIGILQIKVKRFT